jgi:integrase
MVARGINAQTNRAQAVVRQCFAYAISEELPGATYNPATGFSPLGSQSPRVRTLTDAELKALWSALNDTSGLRLPAKDTEAEGERVTVTRQVRIILQLAILLLQRRGEIAGMHTDELNLDQSTWLIPGERMKGGVAHLVPLPPEAIKLIKEALEFADRAERRRRADNESAEVRNARPVFPSSSPPLRRIAARTFGSRWTNGRA